MSTRRSLGNVSSGSIGLKATKSKQHMKSQLSVVSTKTAPGMTSYTIYLLDGTPVQCQVKKRSNASVLINEVFRSMQPALEESDYFGLTFETTSGEKQWLDPLKPLAKQMTKALRKSLALNVKYFPSEPGQLSEYTRYMFYLQLRDLIARGTIPCNEPTRALLGSYLLQASVGDWHPHFLTDYVCEFFYGPNDSEELREQIVELHKSHRGLTVAEAEHNYLENIKNLPLYGVDAHPCKDAQSLEISIGICEGGILVLKDQVRLNRFAWPTIITLRYRNNEFFLKTRPREGDKEETTVIFKLPSYRAAKRLWRICMEHHIFFRHVAPLNKKRKVHITSQKHFSGMTYHQMKSMPRSTVDPFAIHSELTV